MNENYDTNNVVKKKKSHVGLIVFITLLSGLLLGVGGSYYYFEIIANNCNESSKDTKKVSTDNNEVELTREDENTMIDIAKLLFNESDKFKFSDLDNQKKLNIALGLSGGDVTSISGQSLTSIVKKYFGSDATIKLEDIECSSHGDVSGSKVLYKYNKDSDKYEYNDEHNGHGGSSLGSLTPYIFKDKVLIDGKNYSLIVGVYYTGDNCTGDVCIPSIKNGLIYKSSDDASKQANLLFDASKNSTLYTVTDNIYNYDHDKVYEEVKNKVNKYTFKFKVKDDDLVFEEYHINK